MIWYVVSSIFLLGLILWIVIILERPEKFVPADTCQWCRNPADLTLEWISYCLEHYKEKAILLCNSSDYQTRQSGLSAIYFLKEFLRKNPEKALED